MTSISGCPSDRPVQSPSLSGPQVSVVISSTTGNRMPNDRTGKDELHGGNDFFMGGDRFKARSPPSRRVYVMLIYRFRIAQRDAAMQRRGAMKSFKCNGKGSRPRPARGPMHCVKFTKLPWICSRSSPRSALENVFEVTPETDCYQKHPRPSGIFSI